MECSSCQRLLAAIREHRDQGGDNRCWLDDEKLYSVLPEGFEQTDLALHDPCDMLPNCVRFLLSRQPKGVPYISPQVEIDKLRAKVKQLQEENTQLLNDGHFKVGVDL